MIHYDGWVEYMQSIDVNHAYVFNEHSIRNMSIGKLLDAVSSKTVVKLFTRYPIAARLASPSLEQRYLAYKRSWYKIFARRI